MHGLLEMLLQQVPVRLVRSNYYLFTSDIGKLPAASYDQLYAAATQQLSGRQKYRFHRRHKTEEGARLSLVRVILQAAGLGAETSEYHGSRVHSRRFLLGGESLGPTLQQLGAMVLPGG